MKRRPDPLTVLFLILSTVLLLTLAGISFFALRSMVYTDQILDDILETANAHVQTLEDLQSDYTAAIEERSAQIEEAEAARIKELANVPDRDPNYVDESPTEPSVFSQISSEGDEDLFSDSDTGNSVFSQTPENGHVIGIDPGHQLNGMSDTEPLGPGSSEQKAKCSSGTEGNITHIPEYQLNLDVSLKLKEVLESRGYRVVMTRETNDISISNMERAQLVSDQGAEIYVRIHANSSDSTGAYGALTMAPSSANPYVGYLASDSERLSGLILDYFCAATGLANTGIQYTDSMTGINWSTVPVTILEMGFMSNPSDEQYLTDPSHYAAMANGIADGIDAYFR